MANEIKEEKEKDQSTVKTEEVKQSEKSAATEEVKPNVEEKTEEKTDIDEKEKPDTQPTVNVSAKELKKEETKMVIPAKFKDLIKEIEGLTALELSELVKVLEGHFGVSAAAPMTAAPVAATTSEAGEATTEKANYTIYLASAGEQKINVIKAVREITGLGLAESKALVDGAPKNVKENVPTTEAEEAKKLLEEAGATVELK